MSQPLVLRPIDDSMRAHSEAEPQHSANPDTPPPEYSVLVPNQQGLLSSQPSQFSLNQSLLNSRSAGSQFPSPFGPTPLVQSQPTIGLLPYYDLHSPSSVEAATSRARWRFIGAAFWAVGLVACLFLPGALRELERFLSTTRGG